MDGEIADDSDFIRLRYQFEKMMVQDMRSTGHVPVLGLGPLFTTCWLEAENKYTFVLTLYGVYVGVKKATALEGMDISGRWYQRQN